MNKKTFLIIIITIFVLGCSSPKILPYKDTKDLEDVGTLVKWEF